MIEYNFRHSVVRALSELVKTILKDRVHHLNENEVKSGRYVLYSMQASQRAEYDHALEYALIESRKFDAPKYVEKIEALTR